MLWVEGQISSYFFPEKMSMPTKCTYAGKRDDLQTFKTFFVDCNSKRSHTEQSLVSSLSTQIRRGTIMWSRGDSRTLVGHSGRDDGKRQRNLENCCSNPSYRQINNLIASVKNNYIADKALALILDTEELRASLQTASRSEPSGGRAASPTLAWPCLPVLEVDISTILQGRPFSSTKPFLRRAEHCMG